VGPIQMIFLKKWPKVNIFWKIKFEITIFWEKNTLKFPDLNNKF
jgi:hypothetical protein